MKIGFFQFITGALTACGFFMQILQIFPKHNRIRDSFFFIILGVFIGSIIASFNPNNITFNIIIDGQLALDLLFIISIIISLLVAFYTKDKARRSGAIGVAVAAFTIFLLILIFQYSNPDKNNDKNVNIEELMLLVRKNQESKNYERALLHLETIKNQLNKNDPRCPVVNEKISQLKLLQMQ